MVSLTSTVVWAVQCLIPLSVFIAAYLIITRHPTFPFNTRPLYMMLLCIVGLAISTTITVTSGLSEKVPCDAFLSLLLVGETLVLQSFILRAMYVLYQLRIIKIINQITEWTATEETKTAGKLDWSMVTAKRVINTKSYMVLTAVVLVIDAAIIGGVVGSDVGRNGFPTGHVMTSLPCIPYYMPSHPLFILRAVMTAIHLVALGGLAFGLAAYGPDSGLAKHELRGVAVGAPLLLILHFVLVGAMKSSVDVTFVAFSIYMAGMLWVVVAALYRPLYTSAFLDKDSEAAYYLGRQPDISNLADIINSKVGYATFVEFLKSEFSEENILFWREVQTFVNKCQALLRENKLDSADMNKLLETKILNREIAAELSKTAISIFELYCKRGAPAQVNISDTVLQELTAQLSNLNADRAEVVLDKISNLFDSVKSQVFELMDKDSFARFRQSPLYNQLRTRMVSSGWVDTSGGETLDSFDLPEDLITVLDADAERVKALERRRAAQQVNPDAVRQQKKDQRASHMLTQVAMMNRRHLIDLCGRQQMRSPLTTEEVAYPYALPNQVEITVDGVARLTKASGPRPDDPALREWQDSGRRQHQHRGHGHGHGHNNSNSNSNSNNNSGMHSRNNSNGGDVMMYGRNQV